MEEVNFYLGRDLAGLDQRIEETRKRLAEEKRAIGNLLDLAEQFGAQAAGARLLEHEAEQRKLERELHGLEIRREQSHIEVSPEIVFDVITGAREVLNGEDTDARRTLLQKFVDKVEIGNEKGTLWYTFPLDKLVLIPGYYMVPPRGFEPLSRA